MRGEAAGGRKKCMSVKRKAFVTLLILTQLVWAVGCSGTEPAVREQTGTAPPIIQSDKPAEQTEVTESPAETPNPQLSKTADLDGDGRLNTVELVVQADDYGNPTEWTVTADGEKKAELTMEEPGLFGIMSMLALDDLDGDGKPEALVYRYSTGSSGAAGLHVFSPSQDWKHIFEIGNPFEYGSEGREGAFEVEYSGGFIASFEDTKTGLSGKLRLDASKYGAETDLNKLSTWIDPVSEYEIMDTDNDGVKEITAVQRVIGVFHADTIGYVHTTFDWDGGRYRKARQSLYNENGSLAAERDIS